MINDREIQICAAGSRKAVFWPQQNVRVSELYARLQTPVRSPESQAAYLALTKSQQDELKDVGGFVGGTLRGGMRKAGHVESRTLIALDIDNVPAGATPDILKRLDGLGCSFAAYSTRKHAPQAPRLRVLLPLDTPASADEYEPAARKIASFLDPTLAIFDPTTFEANRLMYWPSCCADGEYIYHFADRPFTSTAGLLGLYADWHDMTTWQRCPGEAPEQHAPGKRQEDPTTKRGVIGAFCRAYDIYDATDKFLPGIYTPSVQENRVTFAGGSTTGGAIIYENGLFLYSHHATDPAGGQLCNAFDLVRLHLYGELDDDAKPGTPANKLPSYAAMCRIAIADEKVEAMLDKERYEQNTAMFSDITGKIPAPQAESDTAWMTQLHRNYSTGKYEKTVDNLLTILEHDPALRGRILLNTFANRGVALCPFPWDTQTTGARNWNDNDDAGARWYFEKVYEISGKDKVLDALSICANLHAFDPVQSYLEPLMWDGVPRLDTVFIDYLGAIDTDYTRAVTRKALCAAVARAMQPGIKFDTMTILSGAQGIGKSTLFGKLGGKWFSDSLKTFEGKEACELVQGVWIIEVGELEAMNRSEMGRVKQFLSQRADIFRVPYGRRTDEYPRRCVFFGTSNNGEYLRDKTGNRRFWPIDCHADKASKSVFRELDADTVAQIWGEAVMRWKLGEPLFLTGAVAEQALREQEEHREQSPREGTIRNFVERSVPEDWLNWDRMRRSVFLNGGYLTENVQQIHRERICAAEVWVEALNGDLKTMKYADAQEINAVIASMDGWVKAKSGVRCGIYGVQRAFLFCKQPL
ncbi:MAG: virulence-associated E family protein [Ruthenibacterium sp.]